MQYSVINYSHCAVHYILITYLSYHWKFVPVDPFTHFAHYPPHASDNYQSVLCIYGLGFL